LPRCARSVTVRMRRGDGMRRIPHRRWPGKPARGTSCAIATAPGSVIAPIGAADDAVRLCLRSDCCRRRGEERSRRPWMQRRRQCRRRAAVARFVRGFRGTRLRRERRTVGQGTAPKMASISEARRTGGGDRARRFARAGVMFVRLETTDDKPRHGVTMGSYARSLAVMRGCAAQFTVYTSAGWWLIRQRDDIDGKNNGVERICLRVISAMSAGNLGDPPTTPERSFAAGSTGLAETH